MKKNIQYTILFFALIFSLTSLKAQRAGATYYIQSAISGKNMDVKSNQTANGTPLHLWRHNGGDAQKFTLENAGGGYFYIRFRSGKYVHVQHGSNQPRVLAHIWQGKNDNAKWRFVPAPNGYFYIQSKKGTYLDVKGGKSADGTPIWLYTLNRSNAQRWKLKKVPITVRTTRDRSQVFTANTQTKLAGKTYYIQSAIAGKYMDIKGNKTANGTPLHLWRYNGGNAQKFTLENAGGGYFYIRFRPGKYIHVQNRSNRPKALALLWAGKGNDNTKWKFVPTSNGYYFIQSKKGTYLDVQGGRSADGTPIWMYPLNRGNAQKWKLKEVPNTASTMNTPLLLNNNSLYQYLGNFSFASPAGPAKAPAGPDLDKEPLPVFINLEAELSDRFDPNRSHQYSRIQANLIVDKEPKSGVFYYLPNSYHLEWDKDIKKHKLNVDYGKNSSGEQNNSTRVQATLTSGITLKEIRFIEDMLKKIIRDIDGSMTNPKVKLKPLPVKNPKIEFSGGGFDISDDQISTIGFSDFGHPLEIAFTTSDDNIDALKSGVLQNGLSFILHFQSKLENEDENKEPYDIPAKISIRDKQSYGVFEVNLNSLSQLTNPIPFPILVKYLHVLAPNKTSEGIKPTIYSFDLGNKTVQPKDILKFTKPERFKIPKSLKPLRAFIDYSLLECEPCSQDIINDITGGLSAATKQKITFRSLNLLKSTGAAFVWIDLKSTQMDPGKRKTIETSDPIEISDDNQRQKSPTVYLFDSEKPSFQYRVTIVMPDGLQYEMNKWIQGDKLQIILSPSNLKTHFNQWPDTDTPEDLEETEH